MDNPFPLPALLHFFNDQRAIKDVQTEWKQESVLASNLNPVQKRDYVLSVVCVCVPAHRMKCIQEKAFQLNVFEYKTYDINCQ